MKTVRFLETVSKGEGTPTYESGSVHSLRDDQAMRWVRREKAVLLTDAEVRTLEVEKATREIESLRPAAPGGVHGNPVDSSAPVEGADGGDPGVGTEHVGPRRRGRARTVRSNDSGQ